MAAVPRERRGTASGARIMISQLGRMIAVTLTFTLVLGAIPMYVTMQLFLVGQGIDPQFAGLFLNGMHNIMWISFAVCLFSALVVFLLMPFNCSCCCGKKKPVPPEQKIIAEPPLSSLEAPQPLPQAEAAIIPMNEKEVLELEQKEREIQALEMKQQEFEMREQEAFAQSVAHVLPMTQVEADEKV